MNGTVNIRNKSKSWIDVKTSVFFSCWSPNQTTITDEVFNCVKLINLVALVYRHFVVRIVWRVYINVINLLQIKVRKLIIKLPYLARWYLFLSCSLLLNTMYGYLILTREKDLFTCKVEQNSLLICKGISKFITCYEQVNIIVRNLHVCLQRSQHRSHLFNRFLFCLSMKWGMNRQQWKEQ